MQFENPATPSLHQQLSLFRGDSTMSDIFNSNNQVPFDFPEVELTGCDSIAISLGYGFGGDRKLEIKESIQEEVTITEVKDEVEDDIVGDYSDEGDIDSNKAMMDDSFGSLLEEEETLLNNQQEMEKLLEDENLKKPKKKIKKPKKTQKKKKKKHKKKRKKIRRERKITMQKSSNSIMESLAMDLDGIFQLYPTLKEKVHEKKMHRISTFPTVFGNTDNFCLPPNSISPKDKRKNFRSQKTKSTLDCEVQDMAKNYGEVKSTLVRSKVNNLKGSMLCFEMTNNLREMVKISKCVKWQRRLEYRKELAQREERDSVSSSENSESRYGEIY